MGGGRKGKGKDSGVTADDVAKSPDPSKPPGRTNTVQEQEVGDTWIDHGAKCDGTDGSGANGCFMADAQRSRLIVDLKILVVGAATNYKLALEALRVDELLKKDDDLNWVLSLALDLAVTYLASTAVKAILKLRSEQVEKMMNAAVLGVPSHSSKVAQRLAGALEDITPEKITSRIKKGGEFLTKKAKGLSKDVVNADEKTNKAIAISYLEQLQSSCDVSYRDFAARAAGESTDAELVVLWQGMQPEHHTVAMYKAALGDKLQRFKKSGAMTIGRRKVTNEGEFRRDDAIRDKRVVWVLNKDNSKTLWFQQHDASYNPNVIHRGDPGSEEIYGPQKYQYGDRGGEVAENKLDGKVPEEFWNEAIEISEAKWGPTATVDEKTGKLVRRLDLSLKRHKNTPDPAASAPVTTDVPKRHKVAQDDDAQPAPPIQIPKQLKLVQGNDDDAKSSQ